MLICFRQEEQGPEAEGGGRQVSSAVQGGDGAAASPRPRPACRRQGAALQPREQADFQLLPQVGHKGRKAES